MSEIRPSVKLAQRACEAAGARQAVVVWFDASGKYAVGSYGETKAECAAVKPLCNAIAEALHEGLLPSPSAGGMSRGSSERLLFDAFLRKYNRRQAQRAERAEYTQESDICYAPLPNDPRPCGLPRDHAGEHQP